MSDTWSSWDDHTAGAEFTIRLRDVLTITGGDIGLDDYPIWRENYRQGLNHKIENHFMMREIGYETIDMFIFALRRAMNEQMPYYNLLYASTDLTFDPLHDLDTQMSDNGNSTATAASTSSSENNSSSTSDSSNKVTASSTTTSTTDNDSLTYSYPQTQIDDVGKQYADTGAHAASTGENNSSSSSSDDGASSGSAQGTATGRSDTSSSGNSSRATHTIGNVSSPSSLLLQYRQTLLNIDMQIIDMLARTVFMQVWDNRTRPIGGLLF